MVRQIKMMCAIVVLLCAFGTTAHAATYTVYEGNPSSTYITYFRDILSGIGFNENYVAFRSGQYEYTMVVGDLSYDGTSFNLDSSGTVYKFTTDNSYNSYYSYSVTDLSVFNLNPDDKIVYSDLGQFPQLLERGDKFEMLTAVLVCIALLSVVVGRVLRRR